MKIPEKHRVPLITSVWMIAVPLVLAFFAGAGAGTVFDPIATFAGTLWAIYGGASLILGVLLLGWVLWSVWRGQSNEMNG